jgi:hypothetical protein
MGTVFEYDKRTQAEALRDFLMAVIRKIVFLQSHCHKVSGLL